MGNKILLTGANGFLGSFIMKEFENYNIKGLSRGHSDINVDLSKLSPVFNDSFDLVIHAAGKAHFLPTNSSEFLSFYLTNVKGTLNLLNGLSSVRKPQKFVFISSVSVYGITKGKSISESSPLLALDPYGKSKIEAEEIVTNWCNDNGVKCTILRLPLVIGKLAPGNLGAMVNGIKNGYYFNIGGGTAQKSMVLASDVAKYILMASEVGGIYNLTDGYHPSFYELSHYIAKQYEKKFIPNMPIFIAQMFASIGDLFGQSFPINSNKLLKITSSLTFNDDKARDAFGWNPTQVLKGFKINE